MSRRAILIRVLIFGPLFMYFGYGAIQKYRGERASEEADANARAARDAELDAATKTVKLQDGRSIDIVELTPEQAERLHGIKMKDEAEAKAGPTATPPATATSPTPAAPDAKPTDARPPAPDAASPDAKPTDAKPTDARPATPAAASPAGKPAATPPGAPAN